jgi:hypothetical protein
VFFDPSPPSPLPLKGRGGIEAAFCPDWETFNTIDRTPQGDIHDAIGARGR